MKASENLPPMRIVCIKLRNIGDVLLLTPTLAALRAAYPHAEIVAWVNDFTAPMLEGNPHINTVWHYQRSKRRSVCYELANVRRLRAFRPTHVFDFTSGDRAARYCALSGAKVRVGYNHGFGRFSWKRQIAYTHCPQRLAPTTHAVVRDMHLFTSTHSAGPSENNNKYKNNNDYKNDDGGDGGGAGDDAGDISPAAHPQHFIVQPENAAWAQAELESAKRAGRPVVHIHPVARWLYKCWDDGQMAALIYWLQAHCGAQVVLTCGPAKAERARFENILAQHAQLQGNINSETNAVAGAQDTHVNGGTRNAHNLNDIHNIKDAGGFENINEPAPLKVYAGNIKLGQLAALVQQADVFVGVDTAPMHLAAAVAQRVVALFGPTGVDWHPWHPRATILRDPESDTSAQARAHASQTGQSIVNIPLADVQAAVRSFLDEA